MNTIPGKVGAVRLVAPRSIPRDWGQIEPHVKRALAQIDSGFSAQDIYIRLVCLELQLWQINDWQAMCITQTSELPQWRVLSVLYLAGEGMREWIDELKSTLIDFAAREGCKYAEVFGRPGWKILNGEKAYHVMRFRTNGRRTTNDRND